MWKICPGSSLRRSRGRARPGSGCKPRTCLSGKRAENLGCTFPAPCVILYFAYFWIYARQGGRRPLPAPKYNPCRARTQAVTRPWGHTVRTRAQPPDAPAGLPGAARPLAPAPSGEETPRFPARQGRKAGASFARLFCAQPYIDQNLTNQKQGVLYG